MTLRHLKRTIEGVRQSNVAANLQLHTLQDAVSVAPVSSIRAP
jgi:hypothetical protein